ncbi:hypothetical protein ACOSP7_008332 [Xanthoceras sorbifolium]
MNSPPFLEELQRNPIRVEVSRAINKTSARFLDAFVDLKNFAPVEEIGGLVEVACIEGQIPADFPEGVYFRNGSNPLFGSLKSTVSVFGRSSQFWVEGEGMIQALYFKKNAWGHWTNSSKCGSFWGPNGYLSNTLIFEHSGKLYAIAENYLPQEVDISTLETRDEWNVNGAWNRPFTSHPKKAPESGELVIMGFDAVKPYYVVGVVSADGKKLSHKVDLKFHSYNIIMDSPLTVDAKRLLVVQWFEVEPHCTFHLINCFEDGNEVVERGCRSREAIIPGPDWGQDKFEWFSRGFKFTDATETNPDSSIQDGYLFTCQLKRNLSGTELSVDFPMINEKYTGLKHKYGYTQVVDSVASSSAGFPKYHGLAKLYLDEPHPEPSQNGGENNHLTEVESHKFAENNFCSGAAFAAKPGGSEWLACLFNEETNVGQVHIIDAKKVDSEAVAKITQPQRVPYGFHGTFVPMPQSSKFIALLG